MDDSVEKVKLCDFGISRIKTRIQQTTTASFIRGTVIYMVPETCLRNAKPNFQTDMWCAGASILEICMRKELWQVPEADDLTEFLDGKMKAEVEPDTLAALKRNDHSMYRKVQKAFAYNPDERPTAQEFLDTFS